MSEVLHANIFFFITSVAVVIFTILCCVVLFYVIKIVKAVRRIVERIEEGSEVIAEDISQLRKFFAEGSLVSHIIGIFMNTRSRRSRREGEDEDEE